MLRKQMIHLEFFTVLYLIALPFILHFFLNDNFFYIILLLFLDLTFVWIIDIGYIHQRLLENIDKIMVREDLRRISIYLFGIIIGTIVIGFKSFPLFLILVMNDVFISFLDAMIKRYHNKYKKSKM